MEKRVKVALMISFDLIKLPPGIKLRRVIKGLLDPLVTNNIICLFMKKNFLSQAVNSMFIKCVLN